MNFFLAILMFFQFSLFKRTENAKTTLLQLDDRQTRLDNRYKEIKETGQKIHDLVKVSLNLFRLL